MHHWIELAQMDLEPHSSLIRATPSLFNIYDARSEGLATGVEEWFMHLGLLEGSPRSRELTWIMVAQRAGRALSGLRLHSGDYDMEEAVAHSMKWTPRGWLPDGALVRGEQHLYLRQPGYGTSYLSGKAQIEELVAEYALQQGRRLHGQGVLRRVLRRRGHSHGPGALADDRPDASNPDGGGAGYGVSRRGHCGGEKEN